MTVPVEDDKVVPLVRGKRTLLDDGVVELMTGTALEDEAVMLERGTKADEDEDDTVELGMKGITEEEDDTVELAMMGITDDDETVKLFTGTTDED